MRHLPVFGRGADPVRLPEGIREGVVFEESVRGIPEEEGSERGMTAKQLAQRLGVGITELDFHLKNGCESCRVFGGKAGPEECAAPCTRRDGLHLELVMETGRKV
jgi:hypothetical protein